LVSESRGEVGRRGRIIKIESIGICEHPRWIGQSRTWTERE